MNKTLVWLVLSAAVVFNSGCSILFGDEGVFRSRAMDYKKATERGPLQIPEGMNSASRIELYPVPTIAEASADAYSPKESDEIPHPQGLLSVNEEAGVEVREVDDKRWLVVKKPAAAVFASTQAFVESNGFKVEKSDPTAGVIETGWLKPREEEQPGWFMRVITLNFQDYYDKFRFRVQEQPAGTKVLIDQVREQASDTESLGTDVEWEGSEADTSLTKVVANDLSDFIAEEQANSYRTGVLASAYANAPRTIMTWDGNGFPVLVVTMDMNRAWAAVGNALERRRLKVLDLNRSLGVYYLQRGKHAVVKADQDEDEDDEDDDAEESDQYQLKLLRADEGVHLSVQLDDNTLAPAEEARALLEIVRENIQ